MDFYASATNSEILLPLYMTNLDSAKTVQAIGR